MSHHTDELTALTAEEIATVNGGFLQMLGPIMGIAGQLVNQFGDDKAKAGMGKAQGIMGALGPMLGGLMGGGASGGSASSGSSSGGAAPSSGEG